MLFGRTPDAAMEVYNDFNSDLANLFRCVRDQPMAFLKELGFLPLNGRDEFFVLRKFLEQEEFTDAFMRQELELAQRELTPVQFDEIKAILLERAEMNNIRRAAAFFKVIRYSYGSGCTSYGCQPFDIRKTFDLIWQGSRRLKDTVIENKDFEELIKKQDYIKKVISLEEDRFAATLAQGTELLDGHIAELKAAGKKVLDGAIGFKLYDTFGFPWELTDEILHENDMELDKDGFDKEMQQQRERARSARQANQRVAVPDLSGFDTKALKADPTAVEAKVAAIWKDGKLVDALADGEEAGIILDVTPFYAEGGGQVGDAGLLVSELGRIQVSNAKKLPDGTIYHVAYVEEGQLKVGDAVKIQLDAGKKLASARNHTATHLLQAALKRVVGEQVNQAGSSVTPERLRFDFSNFEPVSAQQLADVEELVNQEILKGQDVVFENMSKDEATAKGAMALFGEKYGDIVRVVSVPGFSMELCGGSHVKNVGQIGMFKIISETGVAAGVRRIEAITGQAALDYANAKLQTLQEAAQKLKSREEDILSHLDALLAEHKEMQAELAAFNEAQTKEGAEKLLETVKTYGEVQVVAGEIAAADMDELRSAADMTCDKLTNGVVVLGTANDGKVNLVVKASKEAVKKGIHAGKIIKETAAVVGGGGGGRPDMAQAGGKKPEKLAEAFQKAQEVIQAQLG